MELVFDADALIKLNLAGILAKIAQTFCCVVPESVYQEVALQGKARGYSDAAAIDAVIQASMELRPTESRFNERLGAGEAAALAAAIDLGADAVIVSDDVQFVAALRRQGRNFLTPAVLVAALGRQGFLSRQEARDALAKMRPAIRQATYQQALKDLEL